MENETVQGLFSRCVEISPIMIIINKLFPKYFLNITIMSTLSTHWNT